MIQLYNTLTRNIEPLKPLEENTVKLYTCGFTVYGEPHIGNWIGYLYWDLLVRLLQEEGYTVIRTQNITDVGHLTSDGDDGDDKLQKQAKQDNTSAWDIANTYSTLADELAYSTLKLIRPDHLAKATDYIPQQIEFVRSLEDKGFTYSIPGDGIYFDTSKLNDYGKLARLDIAGLKAGARIENSNKKNVTDFALWKFSPTDKQRDMEWDSPWGVGFPGWHLECSTIARETLGDQIDIHTGGIDHIPVHHTNEIAQTEALTSTQFAQVWLHNNHLKIDGTKISKSLGNTILLGDITERGYSIDAFKLMVFSKHYQTEGNFTWDILDSAATRLQHWRNYAALRHQIHDTLEDDDEKDNPDYYLSFLPNKRLLIEKLENNLDSPNALAFIDASFNKLDTTPLDNVQRSSFIAFIELIDSLFGFELAASTPDITDNIKQLIIARERARDAKDWQASDELRDEIAKSGITVRDTPSGTVWSYTS